MPKTTPTAPTTARMALAAAVRDGNPLFYERADALRRSELDAWLDEIGACVLRVGSLELAMRAQASGAHIIEAATDAARRIDYTEHTARLVALHARGAATFARRAIEESGR